VKIVRGYIEQAIALDPEFAEAHVALALHFYGHAIIGVQAAADVVPLAKKHLAAALSLDPDMPEAHSALGALAIVYDYDLAEATRRIARAKTRRASSVTSFIGVLAEAGFLLSVGQPHRVIELVHEFIRADPMNPSMYGTLANALAAAGRDEEAAAEYQRALQFTERAWLASEGLAIVRVFQGRFEEARVFAERAHAGAAWNSTGIGMLAGCRRRKGDAVGADAALRLLGDGTKYGTAIGFAIYYAFNDDSETAVDWLEKAMAQRDPRVHVFLPLGVGRVWRKSERWPALARTLDLPSVPS
jgi:Tfp pilus assembly protein PilF